MKEVDESTGTAGMADGDLLRRFEQQAISHDEWTHRAHVKVAYLYLKELPFAEALDRIRIGIKALNAANHVHESPTMGYHETITVAFATLIASTIRAHHAAYAPCADEFCDKHPELMCSKIFRLFYSPLVLGNPLCKAQFLEPDLARLPDLKPQG